MAFTSYQNISDVLAEFSITYNEANFIIPIAFSVSEYWQNELAFNLQEVVSDNSEYAICENFIYPILREVWKSYKQGLMLWSHHPLHYDDKLGGIPDYIVTQRSPLGKVIFDRPFFIVAEAKRDNFTEGWAQCVAELIAIQKINKEPEKFVFGIVSNGKRWEFVNYI